MGPELVPGTKWNEKKSYVPTLSETTSCSGRWPKEKEASKKRKGKRKETE